MKTVVVLGSNSFSGAHYTARLLRSGYRVIGISRSPEPDPVFLPYRWGNSPSTSCFSFHQLDINRDLDGIMEVIRREKPSYVVNFAAQGMVAESWKTPGDWFRTNTLSQVLLHDQLRHCGFLEKYLHVSTPEVYGRIADATAENINYCPTTPYAVSRAAADMSLMAFFHAYAFPVVFTRSANVYGPGQQLYRLIPRTAMAALTGEKKGMTLNNGGASRRSFIHIDDVVDATQLVMEQGRAGEIYHIATERLSSVAEVAGLTAEAAGVPLEDIAESGPARLGRDSVYNLDSAKIRSELGWRDNVSLERGIAGTVAWARDNLTALRRQTLAYIHQS